MPNAAQPRALRVDPCIWDSPATAMPFKRREGVCVNQSSSSAIFCPSGRSHGQIAGQLWGDTMGWHFSGYDGPEVQTIIVCGIPIGFHPVELRTVSIFLRSNASSNVLPLTFAGDTGVRHLLMT